MFKDRFLKNAMIIPDALTGVTSSIASIGEPLSRDIRPNRVTQESMFHTPKMFMPPGKISRTRIIKSEQSNSAFVTPATSGDVSLLVGILQPAYLEISEESLSVFNDNKIQSQINHQIDGKLFGRRGMDESLTSSRAIEESSYSETTDGSIRFNFVVYNYNSKTPYKNISCDIGIGATDVVVNFHKVVNDSQSFSDKFEFFDESSTILIDRQLNTPIQKNKEVEGEQIYFDDLRVTIKNNIQKERITWDYVLGDEIYPSAGDPFGTRIPNSIAFRSF